MSDDAAAAGPAAFRRGRRKFLANRGWMRVSKRAAYIVLPARGGLRAGMPKRAGDPDEANIRVGSPTWQVFVCMMALSSEEVHALVLRKMDKELDGEMGEVVRAPDERADRFNLIRDNVLAAADKLADAAGEVVASDADFVALRLALRAYRAARGQS